MEKVVGEVLDGIYQLKDSQGREQWEVFHDVPPHTLTHYYSVMRRPMSLVMIRKQLRKAAYNTAQEFVRDVAQIVQNSKSYNTPATVYWQDADAIERYLRDALPLISEGTGEEVFYPNLEPVLKEPDDDSSDDDGAGTMRQRRRRATRAKTIDIDGSPPPNSGGDSNAGSAAGTPHPAGKDDGDDEMEGRRKRGRPPTVDKPHEHRIKAILRAIHRVKDTSGRVVSMWFTKIPDTRQFPTYHQVVSVPLAFDSIRKHIKRRQYPSVDAFLADCTTVFNNAKLFAGSPDSQLYQDAMLLEQVMQQTAEEEKRKPDSAYADPDSNSKVARLPLDSVEHRGEWYTVGDWVHISNPNDPSKPTVGQVFRLWRENGKTWANCCWYYRPEQTVHRWDKLFWENEVVKSGQYRDHLVDDILEKCFVMFITKYQRGRPKGIGNRTVYLCESRYNETEKTFNKIRTWKACIPDEIRTSDYPMDMFDKTRPLRKSYSPLRNELAPNAREDDPIPDPVMGDPMAPPLRGAVYKRPYDPNDPPEEPTPNSPPHRVSDGFRLRSESTASVGGTGMGPQSGNVAPQHMQFRPHGRQIYRSPAHPPQPPPIIPSAYILPDQFTNILDEDSLSGVVKLAQGQPVWFPSCPISVTHRVLSDPLPPNLRFDVDGETKRGTAPAHGFGHSARYLAWKLGQ